ncbi:MAG: histone deacetylase [Chloroflexi bacterium]|nr:histone deacetylase [Chloroflexota bacterium]
MSVAFLYDRLFLEHDTGEHPESSERLLSILESLRTSGVGDRLRVSAPRQATVDEIIAVHSPHYVRAVAALAASGGGYLDPDTPVSPMSYDVAMLAAGAAITAVDLLLGGEARSVFAAVRPPGHHATPEHGMGFCLFNNVAIAARYVQRRWQLRRILIVDFDVHHGNGTRDSFWRESGVLYFSVHQHPFYPGSGCMREVGEGAGRGFSVNVPLPAGVGDANYLAVLREVLVPIAVRFQPELILVSAGFDAHWLDPIGMMNVSVSGYASMTELLMNVARDCSGGRLAFLLEGGYSLRALGASVVATLQVMLGKVPLDPLGPASRRTEPDVSEIIRLVRVQHGL